MKRLASLLIFAAGMSAIFLLGWWARGNHFPDAGKMVETRIDTVYYERPQHVSSFVRPVTVNVPQIIFAGESCKSAAGGSANVQESSSIFENYANNDFGGEMGNNFQYDYRC